MMPGKLVLILIGVIAAAGLTVWIGAGFLNSGTQTAFGWGAAIPAVLIAYLVWRAVLARLK